MSIKKIREWILKYGLCVLVFLLPLVVFPFILFYYVSTKTLLLYGVMSILFPLWLYTIYIDETYRLTKKQLLFFIPPIAYVAWMTVSGIFALNSHLAFWSSFERGTGLLTLYFALSVLFVVASVIKKNGVTYVHSLIKSILLSSFILILTVWASGDGFNLSNMFFRASSGGGLVGNSSIAGSYFIFSIFLGIYLLFTKGLALKWKIITYIVIATIIFSPLFINIFKLFKEGSIVGSAIGASLGIIVGIAVLVLSYIVLSKNKITRILGVISVFIFLVLFSIAWMQMVKPGTYLNQKFIEVTLNTRLISWDIAQKSINQKPILGYGPENFYLASQFNFDSNLYKNKYYNETINDKAHNIYYDITVSGGYLSIILYALLLLSIFFVIYRLYKNDRISKLQAGVLWGLFSAYFFQNLFFFDSNLSLFLFFLLMGMILGLLNDSSLQIVEKIKLKHLNDKKLKTPLIISLVVLSSLSLLYFTVLPFRKALLLQSVLSIPASENKSELYKKLIESNSVGDDSSVSAMADYYFRYIINTNFEDKDVSAVKEDVKSFFDYLKVIDASNNTDFRLQIAILRFNSIYHFLTGEEASEYTMETIKKAHELSPTNPEVYWWEAEVYQWRNDYTKSVEFYKKGIAINPNLDVSHNMLIKFATNIKDKKLYDESLVNAEKVIPGFQPY